MSEAPELYEQSEVKARIQHKCCECRNNIEIGSKYIRSKGRWGGEFYAYKTCLSCDEFRKEVGSYVGGSLEVCFKELGEFIKETFDRDHPMYGKAVHRGLIQVRGFCYA